MIHRKRGLLYPLLPSRSYADARIETSIVMSTSATSCIAFLCGRADWNVSPPCPWTGRAHRVPMRTRGLKQQSCRCSTIQWISRSYADARIETPSNCSSQTICCIAFLCGRADWNLCPFVNVLDARYRVPMRTRGLKPVFRNDYGRDRHRVPMRTRGLKLLAERVD